MHCPVCSAVELATESAGEVEIDRCPGCCGIWLDALELEKLAAQPPETLLREDRLFEPARQPASGASQRYCPRCGPTPLIRLNSRLRPGTIIDSCTVCFGAWLDAGELSRLIGRDLGLSLRRLFGR